MTPAPPARGPVRLEGPARSRGRGLVPAAVVCVAAVAVFVWCGVSWRDLTAFAAYLGIGLALPGTLLWRGLTGGGRSLPEDVAAGLALGYAVEVLAYLPARAAGLPLLVLAPPAVVVCAFAAVPRLRRHWRGARRRERLPAWCAWALAGIVAVLLAWGALHVYGVPIAAAYVDLPYHLALVGEVRHHVPPTMPAVLGEPLSYHWFVYAELAATSWVTGIEPATLLYRLSMLPMAAAMVVLVAVLGRRLGGSWGAGVAAAGVTYFLFSPALVEGVVFSSRSMFTVSTSPTQTFGALLCVPVVLLLLGGARSRWVALAVLVAVLAGAKATYLPLLLAGLLVVLAGRGVVAWRGSAGLPWPARMRMIAGRGLRGRWAGAAALTLAGLAFAHLVLFRQGGQGTVVSPLATVRALWATVAGTPEPAPVPLAPLVVLAGVHLFCLACVWGGVAGLGRRVLEPPVLLLLGIGAAGIGAAMALGHPAQSQLYFLEAARPYLSVAAVCGVLSAPRVPWRRAACLAGLGAGAALVVSGLEFPGGALVRVVTPYLVLGVAAVLLCGRGPVVGMVAVLAGYAVPGSAIDVAVHVMPARESRERLVPAGALAAGRWLRAHSSPGDVVATDLHCVHEWWQVCDSRHFWVSAFSERRVLVEGWAYAESTLSRAGPSGPSYLTLPYADRARLAANDAVFAAPTAENVRRLATEHGVTWLFTRPRPELARFATLRFRNAAFAIYRLPGG
ncbi:hypothetical protein [Nonomuraea candida]|uniref:hypothetical protein n=1 Tax=Nonomuraea candida TaxID=359159 RepID=UPI0005BC0EF9|nr:hypothetical protein [Nonomuraea candida]